MKRKYVFEKGIDIPLCYIEDDQYFNYLTGESVGSECFLNFLDNCIKKKMITIKEADFAVYEIKTYVDNDNRVVGFIYALNGYYNFFDENRNLMDLKERRCVINKMVKGEYKQVKIWE